MRNATCAATQTSKVPTRVALLLIFLRAGAAAQRRLKIGGGGGLWTKLTCRNVVSEGAICRMQRCNAVFGHAICRIRSEILKLC